MLTPKEQLIEELSSVPINILRIRQLCLETPGLIASAGTRTKIWTLLLLGNNNSNSEGFNIDIQLPIEPCDEQHVLEADVRRTRAELEEFRSTSYRHTITSILQSFCLKHSIQYKQGMNEVLAPFIYIQPPPKSSSLPFSLFEAFLFRYLERYFCLDESSFLFKSFRLFQILLVFHDPQLALHLQENDFLPELYAPSWFLTLFSRALPMKHVLRLWDMMIAVDDPAFTFFIGLCLLCKRRTELLLASCDTIPEIISTLGLVLVSEEDVDTVVSEALQSYKKTPRCFLRNLRLCCVSNGSPNPTARSSPTSASVPGIINQKQKSPKQKNIFFSESNKSVSETLTMPSKPSLSTSISPSVSSILKTNGDRIQDIAMAEQSVRHCVVISPHELVTHLAPMITTYTATECSSTISNNSSSSTNISGNNKSMDTLTFTHTGSTPSSVNQFIVIDVRSDEEVVAMGGGSLPKAIRMDTDFLDRPDAVQAWLQHFDSMKGCCSICIIDVPPSKQTGFSLLRRLLLGEGDSVQSLRTLYNTTTNSTNNSSSSRSKSVRNVRDAIVLDPESQFAEYEVKAIADDKTRIGVQLARVLLSAHFPYVCVLEGGLPSLVQQLMTSRGTVEPVIINHDHEVYLKYLSIHSLLPDDSLLQEDMLKKKSVSNNNTNNDDDDNATVNKENISCIDDGMIDIRTLTILDKTKIAYQVAVRSEHTHMAAVLLEKINKLESV